MSRTDRHRPYWVQESDPLERNFSWHYQGLRWGWAKTFVHQTCACRWHSMHYYRIEENRQRRHDDQRRGREVLKGHQLAWDERPYFYRS